MGKVCSKCGIDKPLSEYWMKRPALGQFYARCKPCLKSQHSEWNKANPEKGRSYYASWRDRDPERTRAVFREMKRRKELDPAKRFLSRIRNSVYGSLSGKRKTGRTLDILGYSMSVLTSHLERQFLPDMSWDNYGEWHVDHIIPLSSFKIAASDCPEFKAAWSLGNLRPLWAHDNVTKSGRIESLL